MRSVDGMFLCGDDVAPIPVDNFKITDEVKTSTSSEEFWKVYVANPYKLQVFFGYSDDMLLCLYNLSTLFYDNKQYQDAAKEYKFLCILNQAISSFWIGLGLALEANGQPAEGMRAFEKGIESAPSEFTSYLGLIRCSEALKDFSKVTELLSFACENALLESDAKAALEYIRPLA